MASHIDKDDDHSHNWNLATRTYLSMYARAGNKSVYTIPTVRLSASVVSPTEDAIHLLDLITH